MPTLNSSLSWATHVCSPWSPNPCVLRVGGPGRTGGLFLRRPGQLFLRTSCLVFIFQRCRALRSAHSHVVACLAFRLLCLEASLSHLPHAASEVMGTTCAFSGTGGQSWPEPEMEEKGRELVLCPFPPQCLERGPDWTGAGWRR